MVRYKITDAGDVARLLLALGDWIKSDCPCYCDACRKFRKACQRFRKAQNKTNKGDSIEETQKPRGTYNCPKCGLDYPHIHEQDGSVTRRAR